MSGTTRAGTEDLENGPSISPPLPTVNRKSIARLVYQRPGKGREAPADWLERSSKEKMEVKLNVVGCRWQYEKNELSRGCHFNGTPGSDDCCSCGWSLVRSLTLKGHSGRSKCSVAFTNARRLSVRFDGCANDALKLAISEIWRDAGETLWYW